MINLWTQAKNDFVPDGALRDIYVLHTSERDWDEFLQFIRARAADVQFSIGGEKHDLPESASPLLAKQPDGGPLLSFRIAEVLFTCHFFTDSEIECSFAPNDVTSEASFTAVTEFMRSLGKTLSKEVVLTPENCVENPILRYELSADSVTFCPSKHRAG
jgi:hypothetical protein